MKEGPIPAKFGQRYVFARSSLETDCAAYPSKWIPAFGDKIERKVYPWTDCNTNRVPGRHKKTIFWTNTFCKYTNRLCNLDKYILKFGQIHSGQDWAKSISLNVTGYKTGEQKKKTMPSLFQSYDIPPPQSAAPFHAVGAAEKCKPSFSAEKLKSFFSATFFTSKSKYAINIFSQAGSVTWGINQSEEGNVWELFIIYLCKLWIEFFYIFFLYIWIDQTGGGDVWEMFDD